MEKRKISIPLHVMYLGLGPQSPGCISKMSYLNKGPKPHYVFLIEVFSVCISQAC